MIGAAMNLYLRNLPRSGAAFLALAAVAWGAPVALKSRDLKWTEHPAIKGAKQCELGEGGVFHRMPINQVLAGTGAARVVVLRGSISVEIAGQPVGEYGPGAYVSVPAGSKYTCTATAAGECTFLLQPVPAATPDQAVTWRARDLKWTDHPTIKGAKQSALGEGGVFHRLPINQVLAGHHPARGTRAVVLLGSISVEIAGQPVGEYGPGAYVSVPAGSKYTLTATAAGECTFLLQ